MKPPASQASPRRLATPKKQVKLDLQRRRPKPAPEDDRDTETQQASPFWKWVGIVALFHVLLFIFVFVFHSAQPVPKPPDPYFSLLTAGEVVKGKPGPQEGAKVSPSPASVAKATPPPVEPAPPKVEKSKPTPVKPAPVKPAPAKPPVEAVKPPPPEPEPPTPAPPIKPVLTPKPIVKAEITPPVPDKPTPKPPPVKKIKVDLNLADGPTTANDKPVSKPKPKKPVVKTSTHTDDEASDQPATQATPGLSKSEIAEKLGHKLDAAGVTSAIKVGTSGAANAQPNQFQDFYRSVRDQVMDKWQHPNLDDQTAVNPEVTIYVEKDGRVPADRVTLSRSSGNPVYDDSAVAAAKSLGYLLQPLPDGCDPVIHINFKLTR